MKLLRYLGIRLVQALIALFVVLLVVFLLARVSGDPAVRLAPPQATDAQIEAIRVNLGLDKPLPVQFWHYLSGMVHGNLGSSTSYNAAVSSLIPAALGKTAELAVAAFVFALVLGVPLGVLAGMRAGGKSDLGVRFVALIGQSVPSFWLGMLLVLLFAVKLDWLPAVGGTGFRGVILPAIALGAFPLASLARLTRSAVIEVMHKDSTLFSRAKGLSVSELLKHVTRNASLPVVTLLGIQAGALISGTIVIETLFAWPGLGQMAIQAISARDYSLIQGIVIVDTALFVAVLLLVDASYGYLDPRVRSAHVDTGV